MKTLEIGDDYIIYLDDNGKVKMRGFSKYQVIRNKDDIIFLDKTDKEIRKDILEYKLNGNNRIEITKEYIAIDNDFRVMLNSGESRFRPNDKYVYLCVQPKSKIHDIEINTPLGLMSLDPIGVLVYAKVLFLLDIRQYAQNDYWIKQQFKGNRYRRYLSMRSSSKGY